jgi:uncharacterized membrane protein YczE
MRTALNIPRHRLIFAGLALLVTIFFTWGQQPDYTDAFYYYNAGERLAAGHGLTDAYLFTYISAPDAWPPGGDVSSHLYWMPLASLLSGVGAWTFTLLYFGVVCVAFWLGGRLGGTPRHAWVAGLIALFSGFFVRFWGMPDTFTPYGFVGAVALALIGLAISGRGDRPRWRTFGLWALAGCFAGLGHLTRADGLLLLLVGYAVVGWEIVFRRRVVPLRALTFALVALTAGYLLVMMPWFLRNLSVVGTPFPVGGADAIWFTAYDDLFNYPAGASPGDLFAGGLGLFFESRWMGFINGLGTFIAVEGLVAMAPLMLLGLWNRRREPFLRGFWLYALGLHLVMMLVFPYPGYRGGLFHSAAALVPWWAALGAVGLDDLVDWIAQRRRRWRPGTAKQVFSAALVLLAVVLTLSTYRPSNNETPALYRDLVATLPDDARVMINDPTALYYHTGLGGVVLPNQPPDVIPEIATRYEVDYLLLQTSGDLLAVPVDFDFDVEDPPDFLTPMDFEHGRLYRINAP